MAEIEFIDQTLRDGPQSLWGMRMRAYQAAPVLQNLNATGFDTCDLLGATTMRGDAARVGARIPGRPST